MPLKGSYAGYLTCPMCDAEVPLGGDERPGDQLFCPYCETPLALRKDKKDDELFLEEDF